MRRSLIVLAVLCTPSFLQAAEKDWVGKKVMPRVPELKAAKERLKLYEAKKPYRQ